MREKSLLALWKMQYQQIFPDGDAKAAFDQLEARDRPKNAPTLVSLEKQFRECYLREGRDPLNWITMLQTIAMNMNRIIVAGKSDKSRRILPSILRQQRQRNTKQQSKPSKRY